MLVRDQARLGERLREAAAGAGAAGMIRPLVLFDVGLGAGSNAITLGDLNQTSSAFGQVTFFSAVGPLPLPA